MTLFSKVRQAVESAGVPVFLHRHADPVPSESGAEDFLAFGLPDLTNVNGGFAFALEQIHLWFPRSVPDDIRAAILAHEFGHALSQQWYGPDPFYDYDPYPGEREASYIGAEVLAGVLGGWENVPERAVTTLNWSMYARRNLTMEDWEEDLL